MCIIGLCWQHGWLATTSLRVCVHPQYLAREEIGRTSRPSGRGTEPVGAHAPHCSDPLRRGPGRIAAALKPRRNSGLTRMNHSRSAVEHVGGDGAQPASPDHPRRAPPLRISAGMPEFDGRSAGGGRHEARVGADIHVQEPPAGFRKGATTPDSRGRPPLGAFRCSLSPHRSSQRGWGDPSILAFGVRRGPVPLISL